MFCEGIFVNEVIPKLNKTLPGIFNIRVLPDLSLVAEGSTYRCHQLYMIFVEKLLQIHSNSQEYFSHVHCVFCWELTLKQPDAQGLRNFTIGSKPPTFGQMRRGGEELKQLNCCIPMMCQMSGMMKLVDISFWKDFLGQIRKDHCIISCSCHLTLHFFSLKKYGCVKFARQGPGVPVSPPLPTDSTRVS